MRNHSAVNRTAKVLGDTADDDPVRSGRGTGVDFAVGEDREFEIRDLGMGLVVVS